MVLSLNISEVLLFSSIHMLDEQIRQNDPVAVTLRAYAQNILVVIFGLLPLIFIPTAIAPFEYTKALIVVVGLFIALVLYSLSVLRSGTITVGISYTLIALWGIALVAAISSLLSGDFRDSFVGDLFSIHSTVFLLILALIPTVWILLKPSKASVMRMYLLFAFSTIVLVVFHVLRLFFGPDFLDLGVFTSSVSTPVGSWNDLALFLGLTILLSLVALEHLSLTKVGRILFLAVVLLSLVMLGVINFFIVWLILGLTSLVMVVYTLGKDKFSETQLPLMENSPAPKKANTLSLGVSLVVFAISALFVVGGATLGGLISDMTNISYVEVRPSLEATANIASNVYKENAFLGIGTNKFTDAWRLYKDESINTTPFWNTDFNAGNSYVTTFFVTTGVLGGITWIIFFALYLVTGIRSLLGTTSGDKIWYFIGVSSFVSAIYIWGMSIIYVPGVVVLLIGSLCTGVSLYSINVLKGDTGRVITIGRNRRTGFVLTLAVIVVIIASVSVLYTAGRHYSSVYAFNESVQSLNRAESVEQIEEEVSSAYSLFTSDIFARRIAEIQLAKMNSLVNVSEPTEEQARQFIIARNNGLAAAEVAIQLDAQEPNNWSIRGGIYGAMAIAGFENAKELSLESFARVMELSPKSPLPYLESAIIEARTGNTEAALEFIGSAIALKPNFTEAFYFLTQLEIQAGDVEAAIESTKATIALEPQNAVRYYQLGVFESSVGNVANAIAAFEQAVRLDGDYANARYLLALAYDEEGMSGEAKVQLEKVLELNPGNETVMTLLGIINTEGSLESLRDTAQGTVNEATPSTDENGVVSTTQDSETPLVTPVNTVPKNTDEVPADNTVPENEEVAPVTE